MTFAHRVQGQRAAPGTLHSEEFAELQPSLRRHYVVSAEQLLDLPWTRPGQPVGPDANAVTAGLSARCVFYSRANPNPPPYAAACWEG